MPQPVLAVIGSCMFATGVQGHAAMTVPPSRNAAHQGGTDSCKILASDSCKGCPNNACGWYSAGCTIGCTACSGSAGRPAGGTTPGGCGGDGNTFPMEPTITDESLLTYPQPSPLQPPKYVPWRAPGYAPVFDACGVSGGGTNEQVPQGTSPGDAGSEFLKETEPTVWVAGDSAEVAWAISVNHGGGYQYRLCPADSLLTETCFQQTPLAFASHTQVLRFENATEISFEGTFVSDGTWPLGAEWARNPLPNINYLLSHCASEDSLSSYPVPPSQTCPSGWMVSKGIYDAPPGCDGPGSLSGTDPFYGGENGCFGMFNLRVEIVDRVVVPDTLPLGRYVLGWRWDVEALYEVWSHCADITIVAPTQAV